MFMEKTVLHVESISRFKTFGTLEEAIADGTKALQGKHITITNDDINRQRIQDFSFSDTSVRFKLKNGRCIVIFATQNGPTFAMLNYITSKNDAASKREFPPRLTLQYEDGSKPIIWQRAKILRQRVGAEIVRISPALPNVFLSVKGFASLLFCVLTVRQNQCKSLLLSWSNVD